MHTASRRRAATLGREPNAAGAMTVAAWIALAITIFGAFAYATASIMQAIGARRSAGTVQTLGHPLYLAGTGFDILAWAGSMVALHELAVYQVQSVLAGSLALTILGARLILAAQLRRRDIAAVGVTIVALTFLAMSAGPQPEVSPSTGLRAGFCAAAVITALLAWGIARVAPPGVMAAVSGLAFGGAALCGRALTLPPQPLSHLGASGLAIVTEPLTGALVVFAATGMLLYTHALQRGEIGPVTAVLWIGEVVAPSAVGFALLGDTVRPGWQLIAAVSGVVTIAAAVQLATAPANEATAQSTEPEPQPLWRPPVPMRPDPAGTVLWWGPPTNRQPIWRPATPPMGQPTWGHPSGAQPTWGDPTGGLPSWGEVVNRPVYAPERSAEQQLPQQVFWQHQA